jgi:hypothetical protein
MLKRPSLLHWLIVGLSLDAGFFSILIGGVGLCGALRTACFDALLLSGFAVTISICHLLLVPWIFRLSRRNVSVIARRTFVALAFGFTTLVLVPTLGFLLFVALSLVALPFVKLFGVHTWQAPTAIDHAFTILVFLLISIAVGGILGGLLNIFRTASPFGGSSRTGHSNLQDENVKRADVRGGALAGLILIGGSTFASSLDLLARPITVPGWMVIDMGLENAPHLVPTVLIGCAALVPHLVW